MILQAASRAVHQLIAPFAAASAGAGITPLDIAYATRDFLAFRDFNAYYELYWDYFRGYQRDPNAELTVTAAREYQAAHNFAGRAVNIVAGRLMVQGFDVVSSAAAGQDTPTTGQESTVSQAIARWRHLNRMAQWEGTLHTRALAQGDAYVNVGWDSVRGIPAYRFHDAAQITPVYQDGVMIAAYKLWSQTYAEGSELKTRYRLTKYTADRIEKWYQEGLGAAWQRWTRDTDAAGQPDGGVIDWTDLQGRPLGIPIIHFRHQAKGEDFGYSAIADLIAPQDSINKRIAALDEAAGFQGAAQWYGLNLDTKALKDNPPSIGPGQLLALQALGDRPASVGQFPPGDIVSLMSTVIGQIKVLAALAAAPIHLLFPEGGVLPSGEALKTAEAGLIGVVEADQIDFGVAHADSHTLGIRLHNTFSAGPKLPEDVIITTLWRPAATRSEESDARVTALRGDDWSRMERLRRDGYTDAEIASIEAERAAETPAGLQAVDGELARLARAEAGG